MPVLLFRLKFILVVLFSVVFISQQSLAFARPCQMKIHSGCMDMQNTPQQNATTLTGVMQKTMTQNNEKNRSMDCCNKYGMGSHCAMSACLLLTLTVQKLIIDSDLYSETVEPVDISFLSTPPGSLYRPPILA